MDEELAVVATVWSEVEAEVIAAKLRDAGIDAMIRHDTLATLYKFTVDGLGRQDVLVRARDLELARRMIAAAGSQNGGAGSVDVHE